MIVDAHLDIGWNAISAGRGFLNPPGPGYLVSRSSLVGAGIGLVFATLYTAPARAQRSMRTRFVYETAHEAHLMATAQVNYYRSCDLQLIGDQAGLAAYAKHWKKGRLAAVLLLEGADPIEEPSQQDRGEPPLLDRKSTRLNSSHLGISYAVFCLKKKKNKNTYRRANLLVINNLLVKIDRI